MAKELKVTTLASQLKATRDRIAELKAKHIAPLEEAEEALEQELLLELHKTRINTIKVEGYNFIRAHKTTFKVKDEGLAFEWADKNDCLKVDTTAASKILVREAEVPNGFERTDTEYLSVRKAAEHGSEISDNA